MATARPLILVVEDDQATASLIQELLTDEGYVVETVAQGAAVLARIAAGGIDLLLLDLKLPDVDGLTLCGQIRAQESQEAAGFRLPIIVLTAATARDIATTCLLAGADGFIGKPFEVDTLLGYTEQWIGAPTVRYAAH